MEDDVIREWRSCTSARASGSVWRARAVLRSVLYTTASFGKLELKGGRSWAGEQGVGEEKPLTGSDPVAEEAPHTLWRGAEARRT